MSEQIKIGGDIFMPTDIALATELSFAYGKVGQRYPLSTDEEKAIFARECVKHTLALTKKNTADCGDDRPITGFADGTTDPEIILNRIVAQLFGGIGLSATKAVVEADAAIVKDTEDMWSAYMIVSQFLNKLGYEDAGHFDCGASKTVEASVANQIAVSQALGGVGRFVPDNGQNDSLLHLNTETKRQRLESGFYGTWKPQNHLDYLNDTFPQNLATLQVDPEDHETSGHNGSGVYVVTQEGVGYQRTGRAFSVTLPFMRKLANELGGSDEERRRILLGFADDTLHVGAGIVAPGFPVFAQAA
jgi:hypothetical protein